MIELIPFSTATYWLNFCGHMAVASGAQLGDLEHALRPYLAHVEAHREQFEHAKQVAPLRFDGEPTAVPLDLALAMFEAIPLWTQGLVDEVERLAAVAERFLADGCTITAAGIFHRAAVLIAMAEWSMLKGPDKVATFDRGRDLCLRAMQLQGARFEELTIPYGDHELDAMFWPAPGDGPKPTAVCFNGLHNSMEFFWQNGLIDHLHRRGVSVLVFDCPGSGTARFHKDLHMEPATERYAKPVVDYVVSRPDVDAERLASVGCSFGGYRTVRAASNDPRFKMCLAWGALYDLAPPPPTDDAGAVAPSAMNGLDPATILWFMGVEDSAAWERKRPQFTLDGHVDRLSCPLVVFHGAADMQVPVGHAHRVVDSAVNAASRELHVYTAADGGEQHCHLDNPATALGHMTDRVAALLNA